MSRSQGAVGAIDQGTTGTKSLSLLPDGAAAVGASRRHRQLYPRPGWVEHDPNELLAHIREAVAALGNVSALGLANQGETVVAWDGRTGEPLYNAIVWQDNRTGEAVERLKADGAEGLTLERAGLPLDAYFSASKLRWLIDNAPGAQRLLKEGRLRLGTSDAFFLDRLTGEYATDPSTASRTSLMDLRTRRWDNDLCALFGVPIEVLPEIRPTTGDFGTMRLGARDVPITANVVDQQAALFGHGCLRPGEMKVTCGTSAVAAMNIGPDPKRDAAQGSISTLAWELVGEPPVYAVDGSVYNAASAVEWAKRIGVFSEQLELATEGPRAIEAGLAFVPALSGLGGPFWDRSAAGLWIGLGQDTGREDLARSVLEGIALRIAQVISNLNQGSGTQELLPIDGGLSGSDYFRQFLADVTGLTVVVPEIAEITGYGAARLALLGSRPDLALDLPPPPAPKRRCPPQRASAEILDRFAEAVERARGWR